MGPPRKSGGAGIIIGIVVLLMVAGGVAGFLLVRRVRGTALDPKEVPRQMRAELPCKASCKVTNMVVYSTWFSVSVVSDEVKDRTLLYRVYASGAELGFSQDWHGNTPVAFDYEAIDWSLVGPLKKELNAQAISGRDTDSVMIMPCEYGRKEGLARPCMQASVMTTKGELTKKIDATTGKTEDSR